MLPEDLLPSRVEPAESEVKSIVLFTGSVGRRENLRFQRFALLMQQTFPAKTVAWFADVVEPGFRPGAPVKRLTRKELKSRGRFLWSSRQLLAIPPQRLQTFAAAFGRNASNRLRGIHRTPLEAAEKVPPTRVRTEQLQPLRAKRRQAALEFAEERLFREEIEQLKKKVGDPIPPRDVADMGGWNTPLTVEVVNGLGPYLLALFGCPPLPSEILACARGIVVSQFSGWLPDLRGPNSIDWALYHRSFRLLGATVCLGGADSGPILRRSWLALNKNDDSATVLCRSGALGTELLLDVVRDIVEGKPLLVFPQTRPGQTRIAADYTNSVNARILADEKTGWLREALRRTRAF